MTVNLFHSLIFKKSHLKFYVVSDNIHFHSFKLIIKLSKYLLIKIHGYLYKVNK